jgi:hypothetical protein
MARVLFLGLMILSFGAAADSDDGFIWIDANTRIKVKPVKAGAGATAPVPAKEAAKPEKKEKARK